MDAPDIKYKSIGKVVSVQGPVVHVKFQTQEDVPNVLGLIMTHTDEEEEVFLEVAEHAPGHIARCISINSTINILRYAKAYNLGIQERPGSGDGF